MNGRTGSWWGWLLLVFVVIAVFGSSDSRPSLLPLIIVAIIMSKVFQRRRSLNPQQRRHVGHGGTGAHQHGQRPVGQGTSTPQDSPMPTIDVPRYPGDGPLPGSPPPPYAMPVPPSGTTAPAPPPPFPPGGSPAYSPPPRVPGAGTGAGATPAGGAPHTSTDPVVSLGQLHLSRCGRDLQTAAERGTTTEVARVLDEVRDLSRRMQEMLGSAEGTPGSGRREFAAGLRALDRLVEDARGEHPPGARLTRVTQACLRMGQTGRHE